MTNINTELLLSGLKEYFATPRMLELIEEIFHGPFKINKVTKGIALVLQAVIAVEKLAADSSEIGLGAGKEKKEAVKKWLDGVVDLPFYLEPFDGPAIGMAIDATVLWLNVFSGKGWIDKFKSFL